MGLQCIFDLFRNSCNIRDSGVCSHHPPVSHFTPFCTISTPSVPNTRPLESQFWVITVAQRSFNVRLFPFLLNCFTDDCVSSVLQGPDYPVCESEGDVNQTVNTDQFELACDTPVLKRTHPPWGRRGSRERARRFSWVTLMLGSSYWGVVKTVLGWLITL